MAQKKAPRHIDIGGVVYKLCVLRVQEFYEDGTPEDLTRIKEDMTCELDPVDKTKNTFITAYLPRKVL